MPLFIWSDDYSVKVVDFDNQHKKLIGMINELYDSMKDGKGRTVLEDIFNRLIDYTVFHFQNEEKLFQKYNYPKMQDHMTAHAELTSQVKELQAKFKSGNMFVTIDVLNFLKDWLTKHILSADKEYSAFLNSKGIK